MTFKVTVTFKGQNAPEFRASCAKTADPIELKFRAGTQMGPHNSVCDFGVDPPKGGGTTPQWARDLEIFATRPAALYDGCVAIRRSEPILVSFCRARRVLFGR